MKLNHSGQKKFIEWIKLLFSLGWRKEQVIKLNRLWLKTHDEYGKYINFKEKQNELER